MTDSNFKLISKYALLLSICYLLEFAFNRYLRSSHADLVPRIDPFLVSATPYFLTLLLNVITVIIVYRDKVTNHTRTKYVILATVLYRPVGVVAFLLYSIYDKASGPHATQI